jgi:hypothetical protein
VAATSLLRPLLAKSCSRRCCCFRSVIPLRTSSTSFRLRPHCNIKFAPVAIYALKLVSPLSRQSYLSDALSLVRKKRALMYVQQASLIITCPSSQGISHVSCTSVSGVKRLHVSAPFPYSINERGNDLFTLLSTWSSFNRPHHPPPHAQPSHSCVVISLGASLVIQPFRIPLYVIVLTFRFQGRSII